MSSLGIVRRGVFGLWAFVYGSLLLICFFVVESAFAAWVDYPFLCAAGEVWRGCVFCASLRQQDMSCRLRVLAHKGCCCIVFFFRSVFAAACRAMAP